MHRYECEVKKLNERIQKIEERMEEWSQGGRGVNSAREDGHVANWEYDGRRVGGWGGWHQWDGEWAQWDGEWWVRVGRSSLNAHKENITRFAAADRARAERCAEALAEAEMRDVEGERIDGRVRKDSARRPVVGRRNRENQRRRR